MFSNRLVLKILDYLDQNFTQKVSIDEISDSFHYNKDYIMRLFKKEIHCTIVDYLNRKRVYQSIEALRNNSNSILTIALNYGFYSQEYYSEIFHKLLGVSPRIYRDYLLFHTNVTDEDISIILNHTMELSLFFKSVTKYRNNTPPKESILQYSIFH